MKQLLVNKFLLLSILFFCLSICVAFFDFIDLALMFLVIACILVLVFVKKQPLGFSSTTFIFIIFSIIYGLAGPLTQRWFGGINQIFGDRFDFPHYILAFSLSEIGLVIGYCLYLSRNKTDGIINNRIANVSIRSIEFLRIVSMVLIIVGVLFQLINTVRIGGFETIFADKAYYQAAESSLVATLPAEMIVNLAFGCLSLYIGMCKHFRLSVKVKSLVFVLLAALPYFMILFLLGQRGKILSILIIVFLGVTAFRPLKTISKRALLIGVVVYLVFAFVYTNRGSVSLLTSDTDEFFSRVTNLERYEDGLNPGKNEFSCAFGNFNKFIIEDNYEFKFGKSYLDGLALAVPSFLYIGEKPKQITYEFRDSYFYAESKRSEVAGTAFSSILESYWNFGYVGIFLTFCIYGFLVMYLDYSFSKKSMFKLLFVIVFSGSLMRFSRVQLGDIITDAIYDGIYMIILVYVPYIIYNSRNKDIKWVTE